MNAKTAGAPVAASLVLVLAWVLKISTGIEVPSDIQTALAGIVGFVASYLIPHGGPST